MKCEVCRDIFPATVSCPDGHFICDSCHSLEGTEVIKRICSVSKDKDPLALANRIMKYPAIKMHGPEHHFLVPAVLISAYYNTTGEPEKIFAALKKAEERAKNVLGGFCGFYGTCGAAMGTGIFMSIILDSTPLKEDEWRLSNMLTSESLQIIARKGGPRCCKRDSYLAIETCIDFLEEHLDVSLERSAIECSFHLRNRQCKRSDCLYYPGSS